MTWEERSQLYKLCAIPMFVTFCILLIYFVYLMQNAILQTPWDFLTRFGLLFAISVAAMGLTSLFSDASHEMTTAILAQFLVIELHGSAGVLGLIEGLADFSSSFVKTYSGWLSDKLGKRKPLATLGYTLTGTFISLFAFAGSFIHVLFYRTVGWIGRGIREPSRDALLAESVEPESYGHAFGFHRMMDTLGAIVGPGVAFVLLPLIGFRSVFLVALLPGILAVLVFAFFTKEKTVRRKKTGEKRKMLADIKGLPVEFKRLLLAVGIFGAGNFANTFLLLRSTEALAPSLGVVAAGSISALFYVLLNVGFAVFAYVFGALADRFSKRGLLALAYLVFITYCAGFILLQPAVWTYVGLFLVAGVETGAIDAVERSYAAELLGENKRGTGFGVMSTINGIGDLTSSVTAGVLWTILSPNASFVYGAALASVAITTLMVHK